MSSYFPDRVGYIISISPVGTIGLWYIRNQKAMPSGCYPVILHSNAVETWKGEGGTETGSERNLGQSFGRSAKAKLLLKCSMKLSDFGVEKLGDDPMKPSRRC
jgi:hypothetical protein